VKKPIDQLSISSVILLREKKRLEYEKLAKEMRAKLAQIQDEMDECEHAADMLKNNLDVVSIAQAEAVLEIKGTTRTMGVDGRAAIADAMLDIAAGGAYLFEGYRGTKNYGGIYGQRCDLAYGYGPTHGHITFSIGLSARARSRMDKKLSKREQEVCLYYLLNLDKIQHGEGVAQ
jgi:hypothetical protein